MTNDEGTLQATLESTADGILAVDDHGRTLFANRRFAELWRIPNELLATRDDDAMLAFVLDQLVDGEDFLAKVRELYQSADESFDVLLFKDGRVLERYSRALLSDGGVGGRVWSFRDTTDRHRAEARLSEAEARFRTLVEQVPMVTYVDGLQGADHTQYISPQVTTLAGYTPAEWLADPDLWEKVMHPEDRAREVEASIRHHETGEAYRSDYRIVTRSGAIKWIRDEAVVVHDDAGQALFCQGVMYDVTDRVEVVEALRAALQREREAAEQLRALDEMKNTFLTAVSHELRTPLTSILGAALTLRQQKALPEEDQEDLLDRLASNARKLDRLLSDLLDLDRLRRGIVEPRRRPTDVGDLVRRSVEQSGLLGDRAVSIDAPSLVVPVEPAQVERIIENLLANVARHTPPGTPIWVRVRPEGDGALLAIEDAGPGIPEELRSAIFEPFYQAPSTNGSSSRGVGIGLSLVDRFAELHGGRAWLEERDGGGASFRVLLPAQAAESLAESLEE